MMDGWTVLVGGIVVGEYLLVTVADGLNWRALGLPLPPEMAEAVEEGHYQRVKAYTRAKMIPALLQRTLWLVLALLFWQLGGFARLDTWAHDMGTGPVTVGLWYLGALALAVWLVDQPFELYQIFGVEERFGFNRATRKVVAVDTLKGLILATGLGGGVLAVVLALWQWGGQNAWWYGWLVVSLLVVLLQWVAPRWLLPLFNRFQPLPSGALKTAILDYTRSVSFPVEGIYEIDGSKRSSKANAFLTGFGKQRRIALFDTLIQNHSVTGLVAVLAHEVGHWRAGHVWKRLVMGLLHLGIMFWLVEWCRSDPSILAVFGVAVGSVHVGLAIFGWLFAPVNLAITVAIQAVSRRFERSADAFAVATADAEALVVVLRQLASANLAHLTPHPWYVLLHGSHPPVVERIREIRQMSGATMPSGDLKEQGGRRHC